MKGVTRWVAALITTTTVMLVACGGGGGGSDDDEFIYLGETARYKFDETSGSTAYNSEFDFLHGTIIGAARVPGARGNALNFGATSGSHVLFDICCDESAQWSAEISFPENTVTLAAWLMPTSMVGATRYPIFGGADGGSQSMKLLVNDERVEFYVNPERNGTTPILTVQSTSKLINSVWQHVAVTYDGTTAILYINGVEDARANITMPIQNFVPDYFIGGIPSEYPVTGERSFPGAIDDFILSTLEYSPSQIAELAQEIDT